MVAWAWECLLFISWLKRMVVASRLRVWEKAKALLLQFVFLCSTITYRHLEQLRKFLDSHDLSGIRVLTIDDEPDSLDMLSVVLDQAGAESLSVTSAAEFFAVLASFQPDVVVSDIGMPAIDGYMLLKQVRSLTPEQGGLVPAVALTAYAGALDRQQAIAAGFQAHVAKPVEPDRLVSAIASLLTEQRN